MAPRRPRSATAPTLLAAGLSAFTVLGLGFIGSSALSGADPFDAALSVPLPSLTPPAPVQAPSGLLPPTSGVQATDTEDGAETGLDGGTAGSVTGGADVGAAAGSPVAGPGAGPAEPDASGTATLALQPPLPADPVDGPSTDVTTTGTGAADIVLAGSPTPVDVRVVPLPVPSSSPFPSRAQSGRWHRRPG